MTEWISKLLSPLVNALLNTRITAAIAIAAGILLYLNSRHALPVALEPRLLLVVLVVGILCGCLACINIGSSLWAGTQGARSAIMRAIAKRRDKKRIEREIPFLTAKERSILAYLLAKNQKLIEVLPDGEEAKTLISKGFLVYPARHAATIHRDVTMEVPDLLMKSAGCKYRTVQKYGLRWA